MYIPSLVNFFFSSVLVHSLVFMAQCEPIISMCWKRSGFPLDFCVIYLLLFFVLLFSASSSEPRNNNGFDFTSNFGILFCFFLQIFMACVFSLCFYKCMCACVSWNTLIYVSVSAENLEKILRQMERQLLQLERDLETFSSPDDPNDMFFTKMSISFPHACIQTLVWGIVQWVYYKAVEN